MVLSPKVRQELEGERARLVLLRDEAVEAISGIDIVLKLGGAPPAVQPQVPEESAPTQQSVPGLVFSTLGLREAIRAALASFPGGAKPIQITQYLRQMGFSENGSKHPLSLRVSNDLNRMAHEGRGVARIGSGLYRLSNANGQR